ncbi:MAG: PqqD family protein [bacterium]
MAKREENLLDMIPRQLRESRACGDGTVDILVPRFGDTWVGAVLGRVFKNKPIHLHLDEVGTAVWNLCDGRRSVQEIGRLMEEQFGDRIEPVYERLGLFLHQMKKAGIVDWRS